MCRSSQTVEQINLQVRLSKRLPLRLVTVSYAPIDEFDVIWLKWSPWLGTMMTCSIHSSTAANHVPNFAGVVHLVAGRVLSDIRAECV
jgi:hypothetical protein